VVADRYSAYPAIVTKVKAGPDRLALCWRRIAGGGTARGNWPRSWSHRPADMRSVGWLKLDLVRYTPRSTSDRSSGGTFREQQQGFRATERRPALRRFARCPVAGRSMH